MAKVTFVHFGAGEAEIGIQYDADDGTGGTVVGRTFAPVDPALKQAALDAAQTALGAQLGELPADMPPGAVTTALMRTRNAQHEATKATDRARAAEQEARAAKDAAAVAELRKAEADATRVDLDAEIAAKRAVVAAIDAQIAAKAAEVTP